MIDVRNIPLGTRGAIDEPIRAEERRGQKERERERERTMSIHEAFLVREGETAYKVRGDFASQRDWSTLGGVFQGTY